VDSTSPVANPAAPKRAVLGVRASLAVLVLGCVLPMAAIAAFLLVDYYARERGQLIASSADRARGIMAAVDLEFDRTQAALQALSTSRQLENGDLQNFHPRAISTLPFIGADSIVVVDRTGALLMSTRRPFGSTLPRIPRTPLLERIVATGQPGVSDLFMGPIAGQLIYTIGVPITASGLVTMTLNATATPDHLNAMLAKQQFDPGWRAAIIDGNGLIVARTHEAKKYTGEKTTEALRRALASGGEGHFKNRTLDGIDVLTFYCRSPHSRWSVAMGIPLDQLTAGLRRSIAWLIGATVAALALGLGLAWLIGGTIAGSVRALITPALGVGAGTFVRIPPLPIKECNELGLALADAASRLGQARADEQETAHRLALAAEAAQIGLWVRDRTTGELWISDQLRAMFGFGPAQRVAVEDIIERVFLDDREQVLDVFARVEHGADRYQMEFRVDAPAAALRWVAAFGSVERNADGVPLRVRGVAIDITLRKQAELDLLARQKEVTVLARVAVLGELSGALAHELNQPLTAILSNAQAGLRFLAQQPPDLGEIDEILRDIVAEDQRAGQVISRLRSLFSQKETPRQCIDLNSVATGVIDLLRNDLINHGATVRTELAALAVWVDADSVQLQQVLINLLINACDAMGEQRERERIITVRAWIDGGIEARLAIHDNGPGIAPDMLESIFTPFLTTKDGGMGLGLSICRNIVQAHHGRLWAENGATGGAVFHVSLPLASA
jgi:PAS domain S-box-containing protein